MRRIHFPFLCPTSLKTWISIQQACMLLHSKPFGALNSSLAQHQELSFSPETCWILQSSQNLYLEALENRPLHIWSGLRLKLTPIEGLSRPLTWLNRWLSWRNTGSIMEMNGMRMARQHTWKLMERHTLFTIFNLPRASRKGHGSRHLSKKSVIRALS